MIKQSTEEISLIDVFGGAGEPLAKLYSLFDFISRERFYLFAIFL
jgi:hypothetical protein